MSKPKAQMFQTVATNGVFQFFDFGHLNFGFVSDFEFRASDL
jgi:hypothetical protein